MQILLSSVSFGYMIQTCPARPPHPPSLAGLGSQSIFTQIVQIYATCSIKNFTICYNPFLLSLWLWEPCRQTFTPCWVVVLPWCGCGYPTHHPHPLPSFSPPTIPTQYHHFLTNFHPSLWLHTIPTSSLPPITPTHTLSTSWRVHQFSHRQPLSYLHRRLGGTLIEAATPNPKVGILASTKCHLVGEVVLSHNSRGASWPLLSSLNGIPFHPSASAPSAISSPLIHCSSFHSVSSHKSLNLHLPSH